MIKDLNEKIELNELSKVNGGYMVDGISSDEGYYALGPFQVYASACITSAVLLDVAIDNRVEILDNPIVGIDGKRYTYCRTLFPNEGTTGYILSSKIIYKRF